MFPLVICPAMSSDKLLYENTCSIIQNQKEVALMFLTGFSLRFEHLYKYSWMLCANQSLKYMIWRPYEHWDFKNEIVKNDNQQLMDNEPTKCDFKNKVVAFIFKTLGIKSLDIVEGVIYKRERYL